MPGSESSDRRRHIALDKLARVFDEARANHKFVVIDVPVSLAANQAMLSLLRDGGITEATSTLALVPIMACDFGTTGAESALRAFSSVGVNFRHGLIRHFAFPRDASKTCTSRLPAYPIWRPTFLSPRAVELFYQDVARVGNPALHHLPRLRGLLSDVKTPGTDRGPIRDAIPHIESATKAICQTVLAPIASRIA